MGSTIFSEARMAKNAARRIISRLTAHMGYSRLANTVIIRYSLPERRRICPLSRSLA